MQPVKFTWTLSSQPELNIPKLKSPMPCYWGASCYYTDCCRFVHPGEEGTGRKLFVGRITFDEKTNAMSWEPPVVRLIGASSFYERRRKGLSWPKWLAYKNKQNKAQLFKSPMCKCGLPATMGETWGDDDNIIFCNNCYWEEYENEKFGAGLQDKGKMQKEIMRHKLFPIIHLAFVENKNNLLECGMYHRNMTPGDIVEKMLQSYTLDELQNFLNDDLKMGRVMFKMYEDILKTI